MGRKSGNTLLEVLFSLAICFIILNVTSGLFLGLQHLDINVHHDLSYALLSLTEEISMAKEVVVYDDYIIINSASKEERLYLNNQRLVKEPGFNIYLHHIDDVSFFHDDTYVYITILRGDIFETYKIGIYYRPSYRICESNCIDNSTNDIEFDL